MTALGPPKALSLMGARWFATCPGCGLRAELDDEQVAGLVSLDCTACPYHETHDLTKAAEAVTARRRRVPVPAPHRTGCPCENCQEARRDGFQ